MANTKARMAMCAALLIGSSCDFGPVLRNHPGTCSGLCGADVDPDGNVDAWYSYADASGLHTLHIHAEAVADGASATFTDEGGFVIASARFVGSTTAQAGFLMSNGSMLFFSGQETNLPASDLGELGVFGGSARARAMASAALQLGCIVSGEQSRGQMAAILLPYQLLLWYGTPVPEASSLATSSCPLGSPSSAIVTDEEGDVPYVLDYWSLGDGSNIADETPEYGNAVVLPAAGVCPSTRYASSCRGACGVNCRSCQSNIFECTDTVSGRGHWEYRDCPTHACCALHDTCYDNCKTANSCGATLAQRVRMNGCFHLPILGCDAQAISCAQTTYGISRSAAIGVALAWSFGSGPTTGTLTFAEPDIDAPACRGGTAVAE